MASKAAAVGTGVAGLSHIAGKNIPGERLALVGADQAGMAVEHLLEKSGAGAGKASEDSDLAWFESASRCSPTCKVRWSQRIRHAPQMKQDEVRLLSNGAFALEENLLALSIAAIAERYCSCRSRFWASSAQAWACTSGCASGLVLAFRNSFRGRVFLQPAQEPAFEQLRFEVIRMRSQAVFHQDRSLLKAVTPL